MRWRHKKALLHRGGYRTAGSSRPPSCAAIYGQVRWRDVDKYHYARLPRPLKLSAQQRRDARRSCWPCDNCGVNTRKNPCPRCGCDSIPF